MLDDQRIVIGIALLALGYDPNETDTNKLKEAEEWLLKLKPNIKAFDSDSPKMFLISKEVDIGVIWNAEIAIAMNENSSIEVRYSREGTMLSIDNYAILKGSKTQENAYKFIDFFFCFGFSYWEILPIEDIGNGNSPYDIPSAFSLNYLLIDF